MKIWIWFAAVVLVMNSLWVCFFWRQREQWRDDLAVANSHYGYCGAQCGRFSQEMIECHSGRSEVFTLDERREECQRHLIRWSDIPMTCYRWEEN